ncbi:rhamnan synthesis F family protein [Aeromicrobium duanguangcaii]|uniref:Rhamnan synthesis F family protein n=1 Tax=Aeromicrobium duanguangcaii TaxID=2968086 RepID=A0ABY5KG13_9ACTN|nr:rhamnan synthesis F family protein [Aeromicrobium duanguangcaii]MCD9154629.1 rhamnan synthesis F family protein [Aeromicrobium duanguangcaii]UUI67956.1 rhamnan synthesis F family protein [Aeromicrobium duanguangcaii]
MATSVDEALTAVRSQPLLPGLRWDGDAGLWHRADAIPPAPAVLGGDQSAAIRAEEAAFSPVVASRLAALPGPILMVEAAPPLLVTALTAARHEVVVLMSDPDRATRSARWHAGTETVAVAWGTTSDLGRDGSFGTIVLADASAIDASLIALLAPEGRLVLSLTGPVRHDLAERLTDAGLPHQRWDLTFPHAAAPTLLLSEAALDEKVIDLRSLLAGHTDPASGPTDELDRLLDAAPGFVVVAGPTPGDPDPALARFSGSGRRARFRTITRIERTDEGLAVRRDRMHPALPNSSGPLIHQPSDEPFLPGRNWGTALDDIVAVPGWTVAELVPWFRRWADELSRTAGSGEHVEGRFLDAIPRNLIVDGDRAAFIDQEWEWAEPLPRRHVVFRALLHSVGSLVDPVAPDPSVPARLSDLIDQVAALAGEPLSPDEMSRAWEFERRLQGLVSGTTPPAEHLSRQAVVHGASEQGAPGATPHTLRTLAEMRAHNDALRADIETMVTDLDAVVAARESLRDELHAEIEVRRGIISAQRDDITGLAAEVDRLEALVIAHRRARAEAAAADYERELRDRRSRDREADLSEQVLAFHRRAVAAESARVKQVRRAARAEAALAAVHARLSWRLTRPLRAIRAQQLRIVGWWRKRGATTASTPVGPQRPRRRGAGRTVPQPVLARRGDDALIDLDFYRSRHGDLARFDDARLLKHYVRHGHREGRPSLSWLRSSLVLPPAAADEREKVLVIVPETGAAGPALSLIDELSRHHHVVALLPTGGEAAHEITAASDTAIWLDHGRAPVGAEARTLAAELQRRFEPVYAVVGSLGHRELAVFLERAGVPVVAMVSELDGTLTPTGSVLEFFATVSKVVYEDESVASAIAATVPTARGRAHTVDFEASIDVLGRGARRVRDRQPEELRTILTPEGFDVSHYTGGESDQRELFAREYLQRVHAGAPLNRPGSGILVRRPRPGFHPLAYAESAPGFRDAGGDPFAHFLRAGRPAGRWSKRLITVRADGRDRPSAPSRLPSVLVHGHFHYPDLLPGFLDLLAGLGTPRRLVLTTNTTTAADRLREICREHPAGVDAEVLLVPNRGRNLSALFSGPVAQRLADHDLVLHVHGKRSPHLTPEAGDQWREHLWAHLVGESGIGDLVVEEFARSEQLGLVGPEDRRLPDWDLNRDHVEALVSRLGRTMALPTHFDFPLGAMFWARTSALRPFVDARLADADYPGEPLAADGTALHALERLIPLVIEHDGFEFAKTHLPDHQR